MQKINKKGFAISGIVYPILIITVFLVVQVLFMLQTRKNVLDKSKTELADSINGANKVYTNEELSTLISDQQKKIDELESKVKNSGKDMYPVGSVYTSIKNVNPSTLFGGTWVSYGAGRTLVGVDTGQSEFNTVEKTGGEKTHVLTIAEQPALGGTIAMHGGENGSNIWAPSGVFSTSPIINGKFSPAAPQLNLAHSVQSIYFNNGGKNTPHNNLQPYITVYMWKRTA